MGVLFGTDGVRGIANVELTPERAFALGRAGSYVLARREAGKRPRILVGKDTRISGDMLEAALIAGICSTGADVLTVGVIPTPAVAYLTQKYGASSGIVISASHNPVQDNGIKFLARRAISCLMRWRRRSRSWFWTVPRICLARPVRILVRYMWLKKR